MDTDLERLRADFDEQAGRSLALPVAGAVVWTVVGAAALLSSARSATYVLVFGAAAIFPLGLLAGQVLGEKVMTNTSPLARLMGLSVLMVNLLWAVHVTLLLADVDYLPLTLGIGLGLHWIVFSWIIGHRVGLVHAIARTVLVTGLWWAFPDQRVTAVAAGVVIAYLYAIIELSMRRPNTVPAPVDLLDGPGTPEVAGAGGP